MDGMMKNQASHWWWLDCHTNTKRSPWLQTTITELNEKTKAMLKLIEQEADSFAQRAEMYYKKRPELVSMVEDFYRTHRLLAERYDQVKPDAGIRLPKPGGSPFASPRYHQPEKLMSFADKGYDSYSECCDVEDSVESDVDDPDPDQEEEEVQFVTSNDEVMSLRKEIERLTAHKDQTKQKHEICDEVMVLREEIERLTEENRAQKDEIRQKDIISDEVMMLRKEIEKVRQENRAQKDELRQKDTISDEVMMLRKEVEKVREENRAQKEHLKQKDQEKIEVIRHLSIAIDVLKQENVKMRSFIVKESTKKWKNPFEFNKFIGAITGKLCNGTPKNQLSIVAL